MLVSKIKVFLDEEELTQDSPAKQNIRYSTILSYTKFRENKKFTKNAFEKKRKLQDSVL